MNRVKSREMWPLKIGQKEHQFCCIACAANAEFTMSSYGIDMTGARYHVRDTVYCPDHAMAAMRKYRIDVST